MSILHATPRCRKARIANNESEISVSTAALWGRTVSNTEAQSSSHVSQVDVSHGDAVTPAADSVLFPVVFDDMPPPTLRAYPGYTVVAEKYQAMVSLGIANTRMKNYLDLWILARHATMDRTDLANSIQATFERRATPSPVDTPLALSAVFAANLMKQQQWKGFISKNRLQAPELAEVVVVLRKLVNVAGLATEPNRAQGGG